MPMSSWESVVGWKCYYCRKNLATHWFGRVPICCQCHGGDMFTPEEAVKEHLRVMRDREQQIQIGD